MGSNLCCQANLTKPSKEGFKTKSLMQMFLLLELRLLTMLLDLGLGLKPVEELRLHQLLLYLQEDLQEELDLQLHQGKLSLGKSIRIISTWVQLQLTLCRKLHVSEDFE